MSDKLLAHRGIPCANCPFTNRVSKEYIEKGSNYNPAMLCHESSCLEGDRDDDVICAGYAKNVMGVG